MSDRKFIFENSSFSLKRKGGNTYSFQNGKESNEVNVDHSAEAISSQTKRVSSTLSHGRKLFWCYGKGATRILSWPGGSVRFDSQELTEGNDGKSGSLKPLKITMPGKVLAVKVKEGDLIEPGTPLLIVEAMKMENLLQASARAKIKKVHVKEGDRLDSGALLLSFEEAP